MRMEKLTSKFQMAIADAQSLAIGRDHQFIEPLHLMAALLAQEGGSIPHLLAKADVNVTNLRSKLGEALDRLPKVEGNGGDVRDVDAHSRWRQLGRGPQCGAVERALAQASGYAQDLDIVLVDTPHRRRIRCRSGTPPRSCRPNTPSIRPATPPTPLSADRSRSQRPCGSSRR